MSNTNRQAAERAAVLALATRCGTHARAGGPRPSRWFVQAAGGGKGGYVAALWERCARCPAPGTGTVEAGGPCACELDDHVLVFRVEESSPEAAFTAWRLLFDATVAGGPSA